MPIGKNHQLNLEDHDVVQLGNELELFLYFSYVSKGSYSSLNHILVLSFILFPLHQILDKR